MSKAKIKQLLFDIWSTKFDIMIISMLLGKVTITQVF